MIFIIGGYAQGKLNYVLNKYNFTADDVFDAEIMDISVYEKYKIIYHAELLVKKWIDNNEIVTEKSLEMCEKCKDKIIISQEIGCGIVPLTYEERVFRENVGRVNIMFAEYSETVEKVCCGIGMKIK